MNSWVLTLDSGLDRLVQFAFQSRESWWLGLKIDLCMSDYLFRYHSSFLMISFYICGKISVAILKVLTVLENHLNSLDRRLEFTAFLCVFIVLGFVCPWPPDLTLYFVLTGTTIGVGELCLLCPLFWDIMSLHILSWPQTDLASNKHFIKL